MRVSVPAPYLFAALAIFVSRSPATAALYDNGAPDHHDAWEMTSFVQADNFLLSRSARIEHVTFWAAETPLSFAGSVDWQIHSNSSDNGPGDVVASGTS